MDEYSHPKQVRQLISSDANINIFDLFSVLYSYCDPIFTEIHRPLRRADIARDVERHSQVLENRALPSGNRDLTTLQQQTRSLLIKELGYDDDPIQFGMHCYAILRAIDRHYGYFAARNLNLANFSTLRPHLNLNTALGYVYYKLESPIYTLRNRKTFRTGRSKGIYLRDRLYNFVYLPVRVGYHVDFGVLDSMTRFCFPDDLTDYKIALIPLLDQVKQSKMECFGPDAEDTMSFLITGLEEQEKVMQEVLCVLGQLNDKGVTIVVFPELCMPEEVRNTIAQALRENKFPNIKMVFAGSFHDQVDHQWYNISHVLGPDGETIWKQYKLQPYTLMPYEANAIKALAEFSDYEYTENIDVPSPREIVIRDTPLGRMVIMICSDFLLRDPHKDILFDLCVNFIVVPAMSAQIDNDFLREAKNHAIYSQAFTVLSNTCAMPRECAHKKEKEAKISFAYRPDHPAIWWYTCPICIGECTHRKCYEDFIIRIGDW